MKISADFQIYISVLSRNMKNIKPTKYVLCKYQRLMQIKKFFLILSTVSFLSNFARIWVLIESLDKMKTAGQAICRSSTWSSTSTSVSSLGLSLDYSLSSTVLKQITRSILKLHINDKNQYHIASSTYINAVCSAQSFKSTTLK